MNSLINFAEEANKRNKEFDQGYILLYSNPPEKNPPPEKIPVNSTYPKIVEVLTYFIFKNNSNIQTL